MEITYRNASYRELPFGGGKLVRRAEASVGTIRRFGANRTEAKAALLAAIVEQLDHAYTRRYLRTDDVTFALYYNDGWCYDIVTGDGQRTSSTMLGETTERDALAAMYRHFDQYVVGKDMQRVDRTNGELDAAILAYREEPTEANHDRVIAAQEAHNDAFLREQVAEYQAATHR